MEQTIFKIDALPETEFRAKKVTAVELLALAPMVVSEKFSVSKELYEFALTHVEVKINDTWFNVKEPDVETYLPMGIETNILALNQVCHWFIGNVVMKAFRNTSE